MQLTEIKTFEYNGVAIDFDIINQDVMINATEMAKPFGKRPKEFLENEQTQAYIKAACKDEFFFILFPHLNKVQNGNSRSETEVQGGNSPLETNSQKENYPSETEVQGGNSHTETKPLSLEERKKMIVNVIHGGRKNGTWMHRQLALMFAAWLSPEFSIWVWHTIDQILFGPYREAQKVEVQLDQKETRIEQLHKKLLDNKDYVEREELLRELKEGKRFRNALGTRQLNLFREYAKPKQ